MKPIQSALAPTDGYITSFVRNTVEGWWEIEVGLPAKWVFDENSKIGCEVLVENDVGMMIKVFPKVDSVVIDDLIAFVEIVIATNEKIAAKEKEFTDRIQKMKDVLEEEAIHFYEELDELKENSFQKNNSEFDKKLGKSKKTIPSVPKEDRVKINEGVDPKPKTVRKPRAPRTPKAKTAVTKKKAVNTVTEETETLDSSKDSK